MGVLEEIVAQLVFYNFEFLVVNCMERKSALRRALEMRVLSQCE